MIQHIKDFWKRYVVASLIIPSAFAAGLETGKQPAPSIDCKGQICVVETLYGDVGGDRGQIKYTPDEYNVKTDIDIKADIDKRINDKKLLIKEQSKLVTPDEIIQ